MDNVDHGEAHIDDVLGLLDDISLEWICEAQHDVAITNRVDFVDVELQAGFIEFLEELSEHIDDLLWGVFVRVGCESLYVCK